MKKMLASVGLLAVLATACNSAPATEAALKTIKVGVIAPLSGDAAYYGQEAQHALNYELPLVNEKLKASGYQMALVYEDGVCGAEAAAAFQKLTDVEGVRYVIGGVCSSESFAIAPLLKDKGVLAISGGSSNPKIEGASPNLFSLSYSDAAIGEEIAKQLSTYKKVAILTEQIDYSVGLHDTVVNTLKASYPEVQVVADETVVKGATDFRNALQKIKAAQPDVVFLNPMPGLTTQSLVKQLAEIKDWNVAKVGGFAFMDQDYITLAPDALKGMVLVDTPKLEAGAFGKVFEDVKATQGAVDNLGSFYTASMMDAVSVFGDLIAETQDDPAKALELIRKETFKGNIGDIYFGDHSFVRGIGTAVYVNTDGSFELQK